MDDITLALMPLALSPALNKLLVARLPRQKNARNTAICNMLEAGATKAEANPSALQSLPQLASATDPIQHVLRVENALYSRLNQLAEKLCKQRAVLLQHFIREALDTKPAAIPA